MYSDLNIYIDLNWEYYLSDKIEYLKNLNQIVEFAYQHMAQVYFCNGQIEEMKYIFEEDNADFVTSPADFLDIILQNSTILSNCHFMFEVCSANQNSSLNFVTNKSISSINESTKVSLVSFSELNRNRKLLAIESNDNFWKVEFKVCNNVDELFSWILANIP